MSRALPQPPLSSLTLPALQAMANDIGEMESRSPREWFDRARHETDLAVIAERKGKKEEMFLAYTRACQSYANVKMHPAFGEAKKADQQWAVRVKEFKETYDAYLQKAKAIRDELKKREEADKGATPNGRPAPSRHPSGPEVKSMGSIADRMKALRGHGMDVGPTERVSRDSGANTGPASVSSAPPPRPPTMTSSQAANGSTAAAGSGPGLSAGGNLGSLRTGNNRVRSASGASSNSVHSAAHGAKSLPSPKEEKSAPSFVQQSATGSSTRSRRSTNPTDHERPLPVAPNGHLSASTNVGARRLPSPTHSQSPPTPASAAGPSRPAQSNPASKAATPRRDLVNAANDEPHEGDTSTNTLKDFEKAFPSLSEFGKQWGGNDNPYDDEEALANAKIAEWQKTSAMFATHDTGRRASITGLPNGSSKPSRDPPAAKDGQHGADDEEAVGLKLPDVPSFPTLPSAPANRPGSGPSPGLPPDPPRRADSIDATTRDTAPDENKALSPPMPSPGAAMPRPASATNVTTLPGDVGALTDEPVLEGNRDEHPSRPSAPVPPTRPDLPDGVVNQTRSPALNFPVAVPTPPPAQSQPQRNRDSVPPPNAQKPKLPFSNAVKAEELRGYFLNPAVAVLLLDIRPEDEYKRGYVGREYEGRGFPINVVWIDPTVLLRDGMTSTRLEDSLSLSPDAHRHLFENRHKFDLVVVYDADSTSWPRKGSSATPTSRLWDIIYQHEFGKKLERTPVMLVGGYAAWIDFIKMRAATHAAANAKAQAQAQRSGHAREGSSGIGGQGQSSGRPYGPKMNGYAGSPMTPDKVLSPGASGDASKRANRDAPVYQAAQYARNITDSFGYGPQSMTGEPSSYSGQQPSRSYVNHTSTSHTRTPSNYASPSTSIAPPPQASIHPGPGARRRSDYVDHSTQAYSGAGATSPRPPIDYPQAHALAMVPQQPPPAAVSPMDRYDTRPGVVRSGSIRGLDLVAREGDETRYWNDVVLGLTGLKNLGNTCYMNSTIQCLSATYPFTSFFLDGSYKRAINIYNPLGTKGNLANAFAELLKALWKEDYTFLSPVTFRKNIIGFAQQFSGTDQHDSQEFLSFVLDGLHEDLNRVKHKPPAVEMTPEREAALEQLPPEVASEKEWNIYKMRNDSFIVDLFQGQYRNRLECLTCHKTSTTYDAFMYMSLPVPAGKKGVVVQELIDEFVKAEVMEKEDAWNCPRCKVPRKATKTLTIARLPPVLLIQLKRFTTQNGVFWDKSETPVIYPVKGLDLTRYVPRRQQTGREDMDDPRTQVGPFRYDLYGVSNHMGTLSSGHYTAYVKSSKGWQYCEDSRISKAQEKDVVSRPAYILFYKRVRS